MVTFVSDDLHRYRGSSPVLLLVPVLQNHGSRSPTTIVKRCIGQNANKSRFTGVDISDHCNTSIVLLVFLRHDVFIHDQGIGHLLMILKITRL